METEPLAYDPYGLSGVTDAVAASTRHGSSPVREGNIGQRTQFGRPGGPAHRKGVFTEGATTGQKIGALATHILKGGH